MDIINRLYLQHIITSLFLLFLISACGGSGGTSTSSSSTSSTSSGGAPTVSSTSPTDGATGVSTSTTITATFSEDMLSTSIDDTSFTLANNNNNVPGTVTFNGSTNVATFTPSSNLSGSTQYTTTLTTAITNLGGTPLASNYNWTFTTSNSNPGGADIISSSPGNAGLPSIAVDANNHAIAVFTQDSSIWANRYVAGSGWGTAEMIETNSGSTTVPRIEVDANGNAIAVWTQDDGTHYNVWANRYVVGSGWGTAELIENIDTGDARQLQLAVDANGNAIAIWQDYIGSFNASIWANRYEPGTGWGTAVLLENKAFDDATNPDIAFDNNGNAIAVWCQERTYNTPITESVYAARYVSGVGWGAPVQIDNTPDWRSTYNPKIAFDSNNNAIVTWEYYNNGDITTIYANRYNAVSDIWGTPELIGNNIGSETGIEIGFDDNDNALVVWRQDNNGVLSLWNNRYVAGSGWGTAEVIETNQNFAGISYKMDVNANGNAILLMSHHGGLQENRYVAGSGWGSASLIDSTVPYATSLDVEFDSNGSAVAIWRTQNGNIASDHL